MADEKREIGAEKRDDDAGKEGEKGENGKEGGEGGECEEESRGTPIPEIAAVRKVGARV